MCIRVCVRVRHVTPLVLGAWVRMFSVEINSRVFGDGVVGIGLVGVGPIIQLV